jgi:hypothetical protein
MGANPSKPFKKLDLGATKIKAAAAGIRGIAVTFFWKGSHEKGGSYALAML